MVSPPTDSSQTTGISSNTGATAGVETAPLKLALIIPTLNEAGNIVRVLAHVRSVLDPAGIPWEIVVVDDSSADGTGDLVAAEGLKDPRIRLLVRKGERGLSGAVLDGWSNTGADVLGVMDADLQHPPELLPQLFEAIVDGADLSIGSRYTPGGELGEWNPIRKLISVAAVSVTWPIQHRGARASDPMSGFFMVRRSCVDKVRFQRAGFKLLLEVLVRGRIHSVKEVPYVFGSRSRGASKASFKVAWDYGMLLMRLYASRFLGRK
ncbi:MAG: polyprenol monophosphomannose synthase [Terracidiphilus sp.]